MSRSVALSTLALVCTLSVMEFFLFSGVEALYPCPPPCPWQPSSYFVYGSDTSRTGNHTGVAFCGWITALSIGPHVVASASTSSFWGLLSIALCVQSPHFARPSGRGHWGCFPLWAVASTAAGNTGVPVSAGGPACGLLGVHPEAGCHRLSLHLMKYSVVLLKGEVLMTSG